jgi:hypothetical protein
MAEASGSQKVNLNLVAEIVSSYVAKKHRPDRSGRGTDCGDTSDPERAW